MANGTASATRLPKTGHQYDKLIRQQLKRTSAQLKFGDMACGLMLLFGFVLAFFLTMALVDHWVWPLSFYGRLVALSGFLLGVALLATRLVLPVVVRRINPIYAARTIEDSEPSLKNSVLNFLTYRPSSAANNELVQQALRQQAAKDLSHVVIDQVIDRSPIIRMGYVLLGVVIVAGLYMVLSPKNTLQTVSRIVQPWADIARPSRVQIVDLKPGNKRIFLGQSVQFSAIVNGARDSDLVRLVFSTVDGQATDRSVPLALNEKQTQYLGQLPDPVHSPYELTQSFSYHLEAGDAKSAEYRIEVLPEPTIMVEHIDYEFPAYTRREPQTVFSEGDVRAVEGTKVTIHAVANQPIQSAYVDFQREPAAGDQAGAARRATFPLTIDDRKASHSFHLKLHGDRRTGIYSSYTLRYTTKEGFRSKRPVTYQVDVLPDLNPEIQILNPQQQVMELEQRGLQTIELRAIDPDFGLSMLRLRAVAGNQKLLDEPLFEMPAGRTGQVVERFSFVPQAFGLKPGDEVIYWGWAEDNKLDLANGQPRPNTARTPRYRFKIIAPETAEPTPADPPPEDEQPQPAEPSRADDPQQRPQPDEPQPGDPDNEAGESADAGTDRPDQDQPGGPASDQQPRTQPPGEEADEQSGGPQDDQPPSAASEEPGQAGEGQSGDNQSGEGQTGKGQSGNQEQAAGGSADRQPSGPESQAQGNQTRGASGQPGAAEGKQQPSADESGSSRSGSQPGQQSSGQQSSGQQSSGQQSSGQQSSGQQSPGQQSSGEGQSGETNPDQTDEPLHDGEAFEKALEYLREQERNQPGSEQTPPDQTPGEQRSPESAAQNPPGERGQPQGENRNGTQGSAGEPGDNSRPGQQQNSDQPSGPTDQQRPGGENEPASDGQPQQNANPGSTRDAPGRDHAADNTQSEQGSPESQQNEAASGAKQQGQPGSEGQQSGQKQGEGRTQDASQGNDTHPQAGSETAQDRQAKPDHGEQSRPGAGDSGQSGAGQASKDKDQAVQPGSNTNRDSEKQKDGSATRPTESAESSPPSQSARQSDSEGENSGDRSGGGQKGSGQGANQKGNDSAGNNSSADQGNGASNESGQGETSNRGGNDQQSQGKTGSSSSDQPGAGSQSKTGGAAGGGKGSQGAGPAASDSQTGQSSPQGQGGGGATPGGGAGGAGQGSGEAPPGEEANLEYSKQATDLVLEKLRDQQHDPDPDLLEKLGWTKDELQQFLQRWQALKKNAQEKPASGQRDLEEALRSLGLRRQGTRTRSDRFDSDELRGLNENGARSSPPPSILRKYNSYKRSVSRHGNR